MNATRGIWTVAASRWAACLREPGALSFLLLLLVADCAFFALHFVQHAFALETSMFSLNRDRGYPELFQYIKEMWVALLFLAVACRTRTAGYLPWALLFVYLLFDDALSLHERIGQDIVVALDLQPSIALRAQDFGELAVSAVVAAVFLVPLGLAYRHGTPNFRQASLSLLLLLSLLAFFGIFFDMLHVAAGARFGLAREFIVAEDGGEMLAMSLLTWYAFLLHLRGGSAIGGPEEKSTA